MGKKNRVNFDHPPEIGTTIQIGGQVLTVTAIEPYTRKRDGVASVLIRWCAEDGRTARSGLRSRSVMWDREAD